VAFATGCLRGTALGAGLAASTTFDSAVLIGSFTGVWSGVAMMSDTAELFEVGIQPMTAPMPTSENTVTAIAAMMTMGWVLRVVTAADSIFFS
jgi:hypothetical protein